MVIDMHVHPALFANICGDVQRFALRCDEMNYHLMKPSNLELLHSQYALAGIRHVALLPEDCSADLGTAVISNEEIQSITTIDPDFFIGFASADPRQKDATQKLQFAFTSYGLRGLYINTAKLRLYPNDKKLYAMYEICRGNNKPIIFHAGLSLEKNAVAKFAHPMEFEEVALDFPDVNICLAHFGWPWVNETAALLIKFSNVYANTAIMYIDSPRQMFEKVFRQDMGRYWLEHNFADKVMFGSGSPRIRPVRSKRGLDALEMDDITRQKIYYKNAMKFLGLKESI
jgi:predicted TIM-barrel fold metal-dependent hydrolase